jgi:hypothetical protein
LKNKTDRHPVSVKLARTMMKNYEEKLFTIVLRLVNAVNEVSHDQLRPVFHLT